MSWSGIASNQCVSLNNLRDAIANNIFIAKTTVPAGTKQITKTEALAYVDIQTAPLASKASNQLVVKNNLNAAVYTYQRYDLNTTTCATSNPIPHWSYYDIPYGSYNLNGTGSLYQLIAATHTTFTNQITSYVSTACTPVIQYTYITSDVNVTTCAISNTIQWWSYNNYANGLYYINGPGTLYSLSASTHTNYSNQITSVSVGTCAAQTKYSYLFYCYTPCTCALTYCGQYYSNESKPAGYYRLIAPSSQTFEVYVVPDSHTNYTNYVSFISTSPGCFTKCKIWYFNNSGDLGEPTETWTYMPCDGGPQQTISIPVGGAQQTACVDVNSTPSVGSQGDNPYTFDECCSNA
jgi:hypothetical protein